MRALDSRRPRLTSTFLPRSLLFLLLLLIVHGARARSVPRDEEEQPGRKISGLEEVSDPGTGKGTEEEEVRVPEDGQRKQLTLEDNPEDGAEPDNAEGKILVAEVAEEVARIAEEEAPREESRENDLVPLREIDVKGKESEPEEKTLITEDAEGGGEVPKQEDIEGSVAKKRRRNDVALSGKSGVQDGEGIVIEQIEAEEHVKDEGIRRFDAQVDTEGNVSPQANPENAEDIVEAENRKRLIDVQRSQPSAKTVEARNPDDVQANSDEAPKLTVEDHEDLVGSEKSEDRKEIPNLRSIQESNESAEKSDPEEATASRENRHLSDSQGKSRYKSSTVYLNAEEKKIPEGEQEWIVDGQIKKLISIRDDALGAQATDNLEETKLLNPKTGVEISEATVPEETRNERELENEQAAANNNLLKKWKDQAMVLQEQIRNRTFLHYLREQAIEVLPEIPKFTENQLLETLKEIVSSKKSGNLNDTYSTDIKESSLSDNQLQIIKCAEQLVAVKQRQSFVTNMVECIRGLSVLNCMRIFVWPVVVDNLPESISQNLGNLPIEVNLIDLFQGNRAKRAGALQQVRLLTPESVVFGILKEALESTPGDEAVPTFIDPRNETLRKLLTYGQVEILRMAEKFLPPTARREYSDRMFSCVRRFEYFSCVKYFAWPMVKQYFPTLPAFPDYQTWYPTVALYPEYPILPFPSFSEDVGELPEVVEADATRTKKPKPEAVIVRILQDTLKEQQRISASPSFLDQSTDSYIALIPREQLMSIHMAEQLIPVSYRPEFVQKTVRCIREYNYLTCIKYSTWPTVRQYFPGLPDISGILPDFQVPDLSDIFSYFPELPSFPDFGSFLPGAGTPDQPPVEVAGGGSVLRDTADSEQLEMKILETLIKVRNSIEKSSDAPPLVVTGNVVVLTTITQRQLDILRLAESLVPLQARASLVSRVFSCLQRGADFANCSRNVIWPCVARYVPDLPEFPRLENEIPSPENQGNEENSPEKAQERINPEAAENESAMSSSIPVQDKESRTKVQSTPVISVTGTRFVPIFTEHPESVIFNILRSVQLASPNVNGETTVPAVKTQQFIDLLNEQQENIIRITESLLPDAIRPVFVTRMIDCVRENNFLICSRDVLWPTLTEYFPRLPSFPNFGILSNTPISNSSSPDSTQNLTESSSNSDARPLSETNVKTGQHGDATVTITDTRFFPIFNELPETVILNILKAVQISTPNLPSVSVPARTQDFSNYLTEQQINILQVEENLLPVSVRPVFVERMVTCVRENNFLDCTRDIAWPTIAQFFPRLPNFPNFGSFQNLPRTKLQGGLEESPSAEPSTELNKKEEPVVDQAEETLEKILTKALEKNSSPRLENSYLSVEDPAVISRLTNQQIKIIRLVERGLPDEERGTFITRMLECTRSENFISCTQRISWPTLKQFVPSLPDFPNFDDFLSQLPGLPQFPDLGGLPSIPGIGGAPFQELPGIPQLPGGFPQLPSGFPQLPGGFPQLPGGIPQFPGGISFPQFGGTLKSSEAPLSESPGVPQLPGGSAQVPAEVPAGILQVPGGSSFPQAEGTMKSSKAAEETPDAPETLISEENKRPAITASVDHQGVVPGYAGQPPGIFIDISKERVQLDDEEDQQKSEEEDTIFKAKSRKRRSTLELLNSYYGTDESAEKSSEQGMSPNITESEFLQLLINITKSKRPSNKNPEEGTKKYYVETLNSTIRNSLTADQYEILKIVEDLNEQTSNRSFLSRVVQCIRSLSFIRCMGIFVWPFISSNLPSLPSFPGLGILGRSTENEVEEFFGMSSFEFEKELLTRKESTEHFLVNWYKKLVEDKFQTNVGFFKIRGYGNGELGISFAGFREGRGTKIKDNKNLPSILTIISDIMEEVLDQRPDHEKIKKDKDKKERSMEDPRDADIQFLKDTEEYVDIKRSINDDQIITMFLDKIKANVSDVTDGGVKYLNLQDAYNAFGVLFGTRLNDKLASRLQAFDDHLRSTQENNPIKELNIVSLDSQKDSNELKVLPLKSQVTYDFERESSRDQEERQRQKRAKNFFKSFLDKYSDRYLKDTRVEKFDDYEENEIKNSGKSHEKNAKSELVVQLPRLNEDIVPRKMTSSMVHLGRGLKNKMMQMIPGIGLILSFLIQMALSHARTAANIAGMLSNMALGSAMFGMVRQSLFGSNTEPKIKYVYDNDMMGPGISWPQAPQASQGPGPYYHG